MNLFLLRSLFLILSLYTSVSLASSYTVEIIVFEYTGADTSSGELWTQTDNEWSLQPKAGQSNITPLNTRTSSTLKLLEAHDDYTVLMHKAWRQEIRHKAKAPVVTLSNASSQPNPSSFKAPGTVFGYARFYRGQFLQFDLDLRFTPQAGYESTQHYRQESVNIPHGQSIEYRIKEKRRVKPKSVYYFDHPRFGVIVAINSIKRK